jgi:hypothetical protein
MPAPAHNGAAVRNPSATQQAPLLQSEQAEGRGAKAAWLGNGGHEHHTPAGRLLPHAPQSRPTALPARWRQHLPARPKNAPAATLACQSLTTSCPLSTLVSNMMRRGVQTQRSLGSRRNVYTMKRCTCTAAAPVVVMPLPTTDPIMLSPIYDAVRLRGSRNSWWWPR